MLEHIKNEKNMQDSTDDGDIVTSTESMDRAEKRRRRRKWIVIAPKEVAKRSPLISNILLEKIIYTEWLFETLRPTHSLMERRGILKRELLKFYYSLIMDTMKNEGYHGPYSYAEITELMNLEPAKVMRELDDFAVALADQVKFTLGSIRKIRQKKIRHFDL